MDSVAFSSHPLWATLADFEGMANSVPELGDATANSYVPGWRYLVSAIRSHENPTDTAPYSNVGLINVQNLLASAAQEIRNFVATRNIGHAQNAANQADQALYNLGMWPVAQLKGGAAAQASKLFRDYRDSAEVAVASLREANQGLRDQMAAQKAEADAALAGLTERVNALSSKVSEDAARLDSALTNNNDAFNAKQTQREERFQEWLTEQSGALKKLAAADLAAIAKNKTDASAAFEEVNGLRDDTRSVASLAAGDLVAKGYKHYALRQWIAAMVAYAVGFGALVGVAVEVAFAIKSVRPSDAVSWQYAALKLGLTASAVFAAVVIFRLGAHLLAEASQAKRFELELKALGPLFADDSEKDTLLRVKAELVERSFGQPVGSSQSQQADGGEQIIERLADAVSRAVGK